MKTTLTDFVVAFVLLILISISDIFVVNYFLFTNGSVGEFRALISFFLFLFLFGFISGLFVNLILKIRPFVAGDYSMDEYAFSQWKQCFILYEIGRLVLRPFATVLISPIIAKLFGATVGKNVAIGGAIEDPWLTHLSDGAVVGHQSSIVAHAISGGKISLNPVIVGKNATIGVHAVVMPGVRIGDNSVVAAGSVVRPGEVIPPGELWGGIPAKKIKRIDE